MVNNLSNIPIKKLTQVALTKVISLDKSPLYYGYRTDLILYLNATVINRLTWSFHLTNSCSH